MKKFVTAVGIVALTLLLAVPASAQTKERSMGRTWAGIAMIGGGTVLALSGEETCAAVSGFGVTVSACETTWHKPLGFTGIGVATAGILLATVWADVPALKNVSVGIDPRGGFSVQKKFKF